MTATVDVKTLYKRLAEIGLSKTFIQEQALPDWWDEGCDQLPGSAIEAAAYISRRLNLDIKSLLKVESKPEFNQTCLPKFKAKSGSLPEDLIAAHCIASRVAEMLAYTCKPAIQVLPESPQLIRNKILKTQDFVDLKGLVTYCWEIGIPVVSFKKFPKSIRKFDGMVAFFGERPVILISHNQRSSAWLLFVLAHELGHIGKKHLTEASIVDEQIKLESVDNEEIEANEYAGELLIEKSDITYYTPRRFNGKQLAEYGQKMLRRDNVDPGVVILNYAWNKATQAATKEEKNIAWATASRALKIIEGDINAPQLINSLAQKYLDFDRLDTDSQDYLEFALSG